MGLERLINLRDEMISCHHCGHCKVVPLPVVRHPEYMDQCPISMHFHFHGHSGGGLSIMALALVDGRIEVDQSLADVVFSCTTCGYCDVACKFMMDAERQTINMALREHVVEKGLAPHQHIETVKSLKRYDAHPTTPARLPKWAQGLDIKLLPEQQAEVLLFAGSAAGEDAERDNLARKLAQLFLKGGLSVGVLGSAEPSCGHEAYAMGFREEFTRIANKNIELFAELQENGLKTIVTLSGCDHGTINAKYPEYARPFATEVIHATELLAKLVKDGRIDLKKTVEKRVTYHDPCYLGRQNEKPVNYHGVRKISLGQMRTWDPPRKVNRGADGVYDAPRELLGKIPGLKFVEMHRIREYGLCCGSGGGAADIVPEMSRFVALDRIDEAADVGAEYLVTACKNCTAGFRRALAGGGGNGSAMNITDIVDLVYESAALGD